MRSPRLRAPRQADLVCLSHLRWNFVFQRPQHLMSRFARKRRVFFIEEPIFDAVDPTLESSIDAGTGVCVVTPHLCNEIGRNEVLRTLLGQFLRTNRIETPLVWFYTP